MCAHSDHRHESEQTPRRALASDGRERRGYPGDIISEWWARSFRNDGRDNLGIGGRNNLGMVGDLRRNQQQCIWRAITSLKRHMRLIVRIFSTVMIAGLPDIIFPTGDGMTRPLPPPQSPAISRAFLLILDFRDSGQQGSMSLGSERDHHW